MGLNLNLEQIIYKIQGAMYVQSRGETFFKIKKLSFLKIGKGYIKIKKTKFFKNRKRIHVHNNAIYTYNIHIFARAILFK